MAILQLVLAKAIQESLAKQVQVSQSNVASYSKEVASIEQSLERQAVDFVARIASQESQGHTYDFRHSTSETENFNEIIKRTKELHENYGYEWA
ncbi:MAG: hypothetical protein MRQ09_04820 [Candidatus Midichloria sp.]|nr:hypothetical protein [Candidatus Midichloria sp.]